MTTVTLEINEKKEAGKTFLELIEFFLSKKDAVKVVEDESPYNPEFVKKIREAEKEIREGKVTRVTKENQKAFLGL